jgi:twitching motility protein PilU
VQQKRGLIIVVGATGSGKSSTVASLLEHRNQSQSGHILTVEDPIEFVYRHQKSIVNQREIGVDTFSYENALKNAMREAPDVLMIGEIRDAETMTHAINYAQSGHLCMSTLHANNSYHMLNRVISLFPTESRNALLMDLSVSLRAVISQRLVPTKDGKQIPALEILINPAYCRADSQW